MHLGSRNDSCSDSSSDNTQLGTIEEGGKPFRGSSSSDGSVAMHDSMSSPSGSGNVGSAVRIGNTMHHLNIRIHLYTLRMATSLTTPVVVDAGTRLVEQSGWAALSMRTLAGTLGVTPMALYRHVGDSDSLKAAVVEHVINSVLPLVLTRDLATDLDAWARSLHGRLNRSPGLAGHLMTSWFESPATLEQIDDMLSVAYANGVDGFEAVAAVNAVFTYVLMRCEVERTVRTAGVVKRTLSTSGTSRPLHRVTALSDHYTTARFDEHFEYGLRCLISGMGLPNRQPRKAPQ
jgi:AcrR family transcriptional regulator